MEGGTRLHLDAAVDSLARAELQLTNIASPTSVYTHDFETRIRNLLFMHILMEFAFFITRRATKRQHPNIQQKYVFWPEGQRMVKIKLSTSALKSIDKKGLQVMAKEAGIDLNKLPFKDMRPERQEYKEKHKMEVPVSKKWVSGYYKKQHRMKNAEKLAASKKTPLEGKYYHGRVLFGRFNEDQMRQINDVPLEDTAEKVYEEGLEVEDTSAPASA